MVNIIEVADFPEGWRDVRLEDVCSPRKAMVLPEDVEELPYVGMKHIDSGELGISRWGNSKEVKSAKTEFRLGDVLYGKLRPYLKKAVLAPWRGLCSTELLALQAKDQIVIPKYLACLVHSKPFIQHAIDTTSGTNLPRTSWNSLREYQFALPPSPSSDPLLLCFIRCRKQRRRRRRLSPPRAS